MYRGHGRLYILETHFLKDTLTQSKLNGLGRKNIARMMRSLFSFQMVLQQMMYHKAVLGIVGLLVLFQSLPPVMN
jgi:hypothetical protein